MKKFDRQEGGIKVCVSRRYLDKYFRKITARSKFKTMFRFASRIWLWVLVGDFAFVFISMNEPISNWFFKVLKQYSHHYNWNHFLQLSSPERLCHCCTEGDAVWYKLPPSQHWVSAFDILFCGLRPGANWSMLLRSPPEHIK